MKKILAPIMAGALLLSGCSLINDNTASNKEIARTVITTDGEVDDMNSVIRALLYANDMDFETFISFIR